MTDKSLLLSHSGALYAKAGFTAAKTDTPLLVLLGQDRRHLMHKRIPVP